MPNKAPFYEAQLKLLVTDWRKRWGYEFPFAWAQLPNFGGPGRDWPTVREAMLKTLALPKTGMGINIDIGAVYSGRLAILHTDNQTFTIIQAGAL